MTQPVDFARLFRDVVAAGTRHQLTLDEQIKDDGLLVRCRQARNLPDGVTSPYFDAPDTPGPFLIVDPAGKEPRSPEPNENGVVPEQARVAYEQRRQAWVDHRQLYNDLFAARTPAEHLELVVAVGLIESVDAERVRHRRHVVAAPADIVLNQETQRLSVVVSDAFRVEANWLAGRLRSPLVEAVDDRRNRPSLEVLADDAETYLGAEAAWRRARSVYGQDTRWEPTDTLPVGVVGLSVEPAVLLRKKDTSHLLALLIDMAEDLTHDGHVSGPLRMLVDMRAKVDDLPTRTDRSALPNAANDEQRSMLEQARRSPHTIIQGPPGTGKTHTIANLAAVLMAEGRRVLITAENDRALREVQGKLPKEMRPLLLPLLKDKAESGLSYSVTSLIEEADKERRGARPDVETRLIARRDALEDDANQTIQKIRRVDALEAQEHELNGLRMRLAGHMMALDGYREDLACADRYLLPHTARAEDAWTLPELHDVVRETDRDLATLRLPSGIPDPASFAQQLQESREQFSQLRGRTEFDYATLDKQVVNRLKNALARLAGLPAVPYSSIDRHAGEYRSMASDARTARRGLNHGVTANRADPRHVLDYLAAHLSLPAHYTEEPTGLVELWRRTRASDDNWVPSIHLASSSGPVTTYELATEAVSRFAADPAEGLLARYVTDVRHRGESSLKLLAEHAGQLAKRTGAPPTLPISVSDGAPAEHELLEQAKGLREHLADGGKMTRLIGTPGAVKAATPLLEHVTVGGSRVDTLEESDAVIAWLQHRIAVSTARNWADQQDLTPPAADAQLKDWLTALSRLPEEGADLDKQLTALLQRCHVPSEARTRSADDLARDVLASAAARITAELREFVERRDRLGAAEVRIEGVAVHDEQQARIAHEHFSSLVARTQIARYLPAVWTQDRDLNDISGEDPLSTACEVAADAADLPGAARPESLSEATVRDVLARVTTDRRRAEITDKHSRFLAGIRAALSICTPASPATELLEDALNREDATAYREAHEAHVNEVERAERARRLRDATERLEKAHPRLVAAFLTGDDETHEVLRRLDHYQGLFTYRREAHALLDQYPDLRQLHERLAEVRTQQLKVEAALASERCWARAVERLAEDRNLSAALSSLQKAERAVPKTRTAKSYQRKLRAMREATQAAAPAIPCWVMPIDKVAELVGYPKDEVDRFDVVIVDEASQAWFPSSFLYAIAEQVVIVGDDLQTSPADTSVGNDEMVRLVHQHIPDHKLVNQLDGEFSLYDVAAAITSPAVMVDHFRCVPPIIELSNSLCYAQRGQRLLPVRVTEPEALEPIKHVRVPGRRNAAGSGNVPEIDAIVQKVVACVADSTYDDLTFGVVVVGPRPNSHIKLLRSKLLDALGPKQMEERQTEVGSPAQYQGAERNVMFLSLVETPDESGTVRSWPHELTGRNLRRVQALNVAVSRAQDQLWIFHSFGSENLKPDDVRHALLTPPAREDATTLDAQLAKCQSQFEHDVVTALAAHPRVAKVRTQVEALGFEIDIVIESYDKRRLAVECDGDAWHTSEKDVANDLYRQRTLEVAGGWRFQRFLASEWYADQDSIVEQTVGMLGNAPKPSPHPSDDDDADTGSDDASAEVEPDAQVTTAYDTWDDEVTSREPGPSKAHVQPDLAGVASEGDCAKQYRAEGVVGEDTMPKGEGEAAPVHGDPFPANRAAADALRPYMTWYTDRGEHAFDDLSAHQLNDLLLRIVETEGPVMGDRLYKLFVQSAGKSRVGGNMQRALNSATYALERAGKIVADSPLGELGQKVKTFRTPEQPKVVIRELGPRNLHDVPPAELAAVMRGVRRDGEDREDWEDWFRAVLGYYGLVRLTQATQKRLEACAALCGD